MEQNLKAVLVADCHVRAGTEKERDFRAMLGKLALLPRDCSVIFLGDIFDLWIAHDEYEETLHRDFLKWCFLQKEKRPVIFIEGNHEFYVRRNRKECFTLVSEKEYVFSGVCFCHGDQFNNRDLGYIFFRFLLRNPFMCFLAKVTSSCIGPLTARLVKKIFCCRGCKEKRPLPEKVFCRFAASLNRRQLQYAAAGHFHRSGVFSEVAAVEIRLVPAWEADEKVTVFFDAGKYIDLSWKALPAEGNGEN